MWGETPDGKRIPLDPRPPVYQIGAVAIDAGTPITRDYGAMVSHFATCPKASQFSGRGRKGGNDGRADGGQPAGG